MRIALFIIFSIFLSTIRSMGQEGGYRVPLDLPVSLSGSYGELRATHFHAGIDLRVGGVPGASLFAAADGYISRISVSPSGYGLALYIDHPDGRTTLYGHMHEFAPAIAAWVREQQYKRESFPVNLTPEKEMFPVKKGEYIGKAGNTGSSGGAHLHFEVRETSSQIPLNPVKEAGIKITDNISPEFRKINLYSLSGAYSIPESRLLKSLTQPIQDVVPVTDTFYVAVAGHDRQNNTVANLAISRYSMFLNDEPIFSFVPDKVPFDKGRYINSIVEYSEKQESGISMVKSRVEPGGDLKTNIVSQQDGLFILRDNKVHVVKIKLEDEHGNSSERRIKVRRDTTLNMTNRTDSSRFLNGIIMPWFLPNRFESEGIRFMLPPGALYSSILFSADTVRKNLNGNGDGKIIWRVHSSHTPIHNPARLALRSPYSDSLSSKALIAIIDEKGRISSAGGKLNNGWIETFTGSFGNFTVLLDTIKPNIVSSFREGANLSGRGNIRFTISDNLSGVKDYRVTIDGKWILTSYDPKNKRLEVELKGDKIKKGVKHTLELRVTDNKENENIYKTSFIW